MTAANHWSSDAFLISADPVPVPRSPRGSGTPGPLSLNSGLSKRFVGWCRARPSLGHTRPQSVPSAGVRGILIPDNFQAGHLIIVKAAAL